MLKKIMPSLNLSTELQVMKTCKDMGIKTVAIYSDADAQAVSR